MLRPNAVRKLVAEAARQAALAGQSPGDNSPRGHDETTSGAAAWIDPSTGNPQYFGLLDLTPLNEGASGGFLLS